MDKMPEMAEAPTKITRKLAALFAGQSNAAIARVLGVSDQQVANYLQGAVPGPAVLLRIARWLDVSIVYLIDDELPVGKELKPGQELADSVLVDEVNRRGTRAGRRLSALLDRVVLMPWQHYAAQLQANPEAWSEWVGDGPEPVGVLGAAVHVARLLVAFGNSPEAMLIGMVRGRWEGKGMVLDQRIHDSLNQLTSTDGGKQAMLQATLGFASFEDDVLLQIEEALDKHDKAVKAQ